MQEYFDSHQVAARLLGPTPAPIARLRRKFRFHILAQASSKSALQQAVRFAEGKHRAPDDVQWLPDVDPLDML